MQQITVRQIDSNPLVSVWTTVTTISCRYKRSKFGSGAAASIHA
jgi:hypothetical protein